MKKRVITFGEVMMRLSTPGFARFTQAQSLQVLYAGSEANVAVSLRYFGCDTAHVTRFPSNDLGIAATQTLQRHGVDTRHILYGDERMGVYFLENGAMQRSSRIIYDRFDSAFAHIAPGSVDWDSILKDAAWFHWTGITPAISQGAATVCREALVSARKHGVKISGDINYRRNLWQYGKTARDIMPELISLTDYIVAGTTDLENCLGIGGGSLEESSRAAMKQYPNIQKVSCTYRESISSSHNKIQAVIWDGKVTLTSKEYDMTHIVDRVGGGDAFMAGLIYGWLTGMTDQQTVEFAAAATTLKHSIEGDVNTTSVQEVEALMRGENIGKLLR
ncbi:sugar kinase [Chryseolinea lacunae]|uniref:Sugar kinase n=1 Tax=Chryseolinea lacunae TaxID=2801331 RepID=A0ABS1KTY5_9BACT|nr:sugar kinase [Chryseolinea lacunae]MBL0742834.1 sugar kinase [Chryseolinea lacunae]